MQTRAEDKLLHSAFTPAAYLIYLWDELDKHKGRDQNGRALVCSGVVLPTSRCSPDAEDTPHDREDDQLVTRMQQPDALLGALEERVDQGLRGAKADED